MRMKWILVSPLALLSHVRGNKLRKRNESWMAKLVSDKAGTQTKIFFLPGEAKPWTLQLHWTRRGWAGAVPGRRKCIWSRQVPCVGHTRLCGEAALVEVWGTGSGARKPEFGSYFCFLLALWIWQVMAPVSWCKFGRRQWSQCGIGRPRGNITVGYMTHGDTWPDGSSCTFCNPSQSTEHLGKEKIVSILKIWKLSPWEGKWPASDLRSAMYLWLQGAVGICCLALVGFLFHLTSRPGTRTWSQGIWC